MENTKSQMSKLLLVLVVLPSQLAVAQSHPSMATEEDCHRAMDALSNWRR